MRTTFFRSILCIAVTISAAQAQTLAPAPAKPAAVKPAPAKTTPKPSKVDEVIELVKGQISESMIIARLQKANQPIDLTVAEMVKLKAAGASENVINAMIDPKASLAPQVASVPPPVSPAPVAPPAETPPPPPPAPADPAPAAAQSATSDPAPQQSAPTFAQKKRVMVNNFDFSATETPEMRVLGTAQNIGKGIRAMFVTRSQQGGKVVIVERGEKEKQLENEQDKNAGNRNKQGTGSRIGRIQGADAILAGDIVIFGNDNKRTKVTGGGTTGAVIGILRRKDDSDKAVVAIEYRLIDAETSEVIASGTARGEAERKGRKTSVWGALGQGVSGMDISTSNSGFEKTIIGEATLDCVGKLALILNEQTAVMKKRVRDVETTVVDVSGGTLTIGAGSDDGVNTGESFEIRRVLSVLRDPVTKEVLDKKTELVGQMVVSTVRPRVATGSYTGGSAQATVDFVAIKKLPQQQ